MVEFLLGDCSERLAWQLFLAPGRQDETHATHSFDSAQEIDAAGKAPPAVAGGFHEMPAL